jgi:pimeloyl-ACP methyl ester carboxylesterase
MISRSAATNRESLTQSVALSGERRATFETVGTGPPMLMFPGGPGLPGAFMRMHANLLADTFSIYLIDPHGSGGSTPPVDAGHYDHIGHARFYDEVRRALDLGDVVVHGASFGGVVALTYAALFGDATKGCIAVSALSMGTEVDESEGGKAAADSERAISRHAGAEWFAEARATWDTWTDRVLATDDAAEVEEMLRTIMPLYCAYPDRPDVRAGLEELNALIRCDLAAGKAWEGGLYQTIDIRPLLGRVRCPTLVVTGELDLICGPAQARPIANGTKRSTLHVIPECGHAPALEEPEAYKRVMIDWCSANL